MDHRQRYAWAKRQREQEGASRGSQRAAVDARVLEVLGDGPMSYARLKRRVLACEPTTPSQLYARVQRLVRSRRVVWVYGGKALMLYSRRDLL